MTSQNLSQKCTHIHQEQLKCDEVGWRRRKGIDFTKKTVASSILKKYSMSMEGLR